MFETEIKNNNISNFPNESKIASCASSTSSLDSSTQSTSPPLPPKSDVSDASNNAHLWSRRDRTIDTSSDSELQCRNEASFSLEENSSSETATAMHNTERYYKENNANRKLYHDSSIVFKADNTIWEDSEAPEDIIDTNKIRLDARDYQKDSPPPLRPIETHNHQMPALEPLSYSRISPMASIEAAQAKSSYNVQSPYRPPVKLSYDYKHLSPQNRTINTDMTTEYNYKGFTVNNSNRRDAYDEEEDDNKYSFNAAIPSMKILMDAYKNKNLKLQHDDHEMYMASYDKNERKRDSTNSY